MKDNHLHEQENEEPVKAENNNQLDQDTEIKKRELLEAHEDVKFGFFMILIGLILSIINTLIAILISIKFSSSVALYIVCFGILSIITFIFGYWAINNYHHECENAANSNDKVQMEAIDQSLSRMFVNIFLYIIMIICIAFLIMTVGCFAFQSEAQRYVESTSKNKEKWKNYFGDKTFEYISSNLKTFLNIAGIFALLLFILCCFILYAGFKLLGRYRMTQVIIQFICIIFFILGLILLYCGVYAQKYREFAKVDKAMPEWVPDALLGTAIVCILTAIVGYVASNFEMAEYLKYFSIFAAALTVLIIVFAFAATAYSSRFQSFFDNKCNMILDYMNEKYLKDFAKCDRKYMFKSATIDGMKCEKNRIVAFWEDNVGKDLEQQKDEYGCLDGDCCYKTYTAIKKNIDYLALIAFVLMIICGILAAASYYMFYKLTSSPHRESPPKHEIKAEYYAIGFGVVFVIIVGVMIGMIPEAPKPSPTTNIVIQKSNFTADNFIQYDIKSNVSAIVKEEEKKNDEIAKTSTSVKADTTKCTDTNTCPKLKFIYEISTKDGTISTATDINQLKIETNSLKENQEWVLKMYGEQSTVNYFINSFTFNPSCLLKNSKIKMKVTAEAVKYDTVFLQTENTILLQTGQNQGAITAPNDNAPAQSNTNAAYNIDVSKLKVGDKLEVFDKDIDYSVLSEQDKVTVIGKVSKMVSQTLSNPLAGAKIVIQSTNFPNCKPIETTTNEKGEFKSEDITLIAGNYQLEFNVKITSQDLLPFEKVITIGGLGYNKIEDIGEITLSSPLYSQKIMLSSNIINSIDNNLLPNAEVKLYKGYNEFKNENTDNNSPSFIQLIQSEANKENLIAVTSSNNEGNFKLMDISPGSYTLLVEKEGFYREVKCIILF